MTFDEFKKMMSSKPAKIEAKTDGEDNIEILMDGRGFELFALSMAISHAIMKKLNINVDDYCTRLKDGCNYLNEPDEEIKKALDKLVRDLFK